MSGLDLYESENSDRLSTLKPTDTIEAGAFDGFIRGTGMETMRQFARTGRAIGMAGSVVPIVQDAFTGGTTAQDRYFKELDERVGSAVRAWTPEPNEIGVAGQVTGTLLSMIPMVFANPALALANMGLGIPQDLVEQYGEEVSAGKAVAAGTAMSAGLGLGIWMPIMGRSLFERVLIGGAGFNVIQGAAMRKAANLALQGTPAAKDFEALNGVELTIDALLGAGFGAIAHLSPAQRAQGKRAWDTLEAWGKGMSGEAKDALMVMRGTQHTNVDTLPGTPTSPEAMNSHVEKVKTAIDQTLRGEPVNVDNVGVREDTAPAEGVYEPADPDAKPEFLPVVDVFKKQAVGTGRFAVGEVYQWTHPNRMFAEFDRSVIVAGPRIGDKVPVYSITGKDGLLGLPPNSAMPEFTPISELSVRQFEPIPERFTEAHEFGMDLQREAERIRAEEGLPPVPEDPRTPSKIYTATKEALEKIGIDKRFGAEYVENAAKVRDAFYKATAKIVGETADALFARKAAEITKDAPGTKAMLDQRGMPNIDRVLAEHGEDPMSGKNARISVETANKLAKKGHPDAGAAALIAYVTDDFMRMTTDVKLKEPATKALIDFVKNMPGTRTGPLFRVMGFETPKARMAFLEKIKAGETTALQSERPVMSMTSDDPTGKTPMDNIGLDQASIHGDHKVVIRIQPKSGETLTIGRDVSQIYGKNAAGVDVLVPKDTQFRVRSIENRGGDAWVTLEPVKGAEDATLFQRGQSFAKAAEVWKKIAGNKEAFRYAASESPDPQQIVKDMGLRKLNITVRANPADNEIIITRPVNGVLKEARLGYDDAGQAWLDIADSKPGTGGDAVYQFAMQWAKNNDKIFIGDPAGVSPIAVERRTEQMVSAALRQGTTKYMRPDWRQEIKDWRDVETVGDEADLNNMALLLRKSYDNVKRYIDKIDDFRYDFDRGTFTDLAGNPVPKSRVDILADEARDAFPRIKGTPDGAQPPSFRGSFRDVERAIVSRSAAELAEGRNPLLSVRGGPLEGVLNQDQSPRWYSELTRQVEGLKQEVAPAAQWKGMLKNLKGVKAEEIEWTGLNEFLDIYANAKDMADKWKGAEFKADDPDPAFGNVYDKDGNNLSGRIGKDQAKAYIEVNRETFEKYASGKVTRQQILDYLNSNGVKVDEVIKGQAGEPSFEDPAIAKEVEFLRKSGWEPILNEDDTTQIAFHDPQTDDYYDASDIARFAKDEGSIELQDIADAARRIEHYWGGSGREEPTKFGSSALQLPGAKPGSYRELLLTLPDQAQNKRQQMIEALADEGVNVADLPATDPRRMEIESLGRKSDAKNPAFTDSHWYEPNVLAHVRFNERTDADGKRVLFVEEIQSDWAQKGKKEGFTRKWSEEEIAKFKVINPDPVPPQNLKDHPRWSEADYFYLRDKGYTDEQVLGFWERDKDLTDPPPSHPGYMKSRAKNIDWQVVDGNGNLLASPPRYLNDTAEEALRVVQKGARSGQLHGLGKVPQAPFVQKTDAWAGLVIKRMIRYAAENGFDRVAWTRGEQQVERYTNALRQVVDTIEWEKTPEGVHIVGYKGKFKPGGPTGLREQVTEVLRQNDNLGFDTPQEARQAILGHDDWATRWEIPTDQHTLIENWRRLARIPRGWDEVEANKVVDTRYGENELSDAIGKTLAEQIRNDPGQKGVIEGNGIRVDDTGMAGFYDRIVPKIANDILKKLGGGKVGQTEIQVKTNGVEPPKFRNATDSDMDMYAGAESFRDGTAPQIGEVNIRYEAAEGPEATPGMTMQGEVVVDPRGVTIQMPDGLYVQAFWEQILTDAPERISLGRSFKEFNEQWKDIESPLWRQLNDSDPEGGRLYPETKDEKSAQPSFEITPALKAKAMEGLPLFQGGDQPRGFYEFGPDQQSRIGMLETANKSTFIHEMGHDFLKIWLELADEPNAPKVLQAELDRVFTWLKVDRADFAKMSLEEQRPYHEQWARGFEAFLREGRTSNPELTSAFQKFKEWLIEVYRSLTQMNVKLSDDVRGVMDRMLGGQREVEVGTTKDKPSNLLNDIKTLGGIDKQAMLDVTGEKRFGKGVKGIPWGLFKEGGRGLDDLATSLRDRGWPIPEDDVDGGVQALRDLVKAELEGERALRQGEEPAAKPQDEADAEQIVRDAADQEEAIAEKYDYRDSPEYRAEIDRVRTERDYRLAEALDGNGDPVGAEARRTVAEKPDMAMVVGENVDGEGETMTARQYLDAAQAEYEQALKDVDMFKAAGDCLLGVD